MQLTNQTVPMLAFGDEKQGIHLLLHKSLQFGQSQKRRRNNLYRIHLCEIHGVAEVMNVLHSGKKTTIGGDNATKILLRNGV